MKLFDRLKHAWDAFRNRDPTSMTNLGPQSYGNPNATYLRTGREGSIVTSIYNRIALDAAAISLRHVRLNEEGRFMEVVDDDLNDCLDISANRDQTPRAFFQDCVLSMFEWGNIAIFPESADLDPTKTGSYSIWSMRKGKVVGWHPEYVEIETFDPNTMLQTRIVLPKSIVLLIQNPFYSVMNAPNSMLQRLISKLALLDVLDNKTASGKMDLIIQLPYTVKSEAGLKRAEERRKTIEAQLVDSKYGIAYVDATERITQLNRPIENNLLTQIEYLQANVFSQLGMTQEIFDGTADEATNLNYTNRTIEPIVAAIANEMRRKWFTKTARSRGHSIMYFNDPFKLVPVANLAEIADKLIRNQILTPNEFRGIIGYRPSDDPKADELNNPNIADSKEQEAARKTGTDAAPAGGEE